MGGAGEGRRVLLVDDDARIRRFVGDLLRFNAYEVHAVDGCAAARATDGSYDAGVFDIGLADGCGAELARELLASGKVRAAVFFTGLPESAKARQARSIGPVVGKVRGMVELEPALRTVVSRSEAC